MRRSGCQGPPGLALVNAAGGVANSRGPANLAPRRAAPSARRPLQLGPRRHRLSNFARREIKKNKARKKLFKEKLR